MRHEACDRWRNIACWSIPALLLTYCGNFATEPDPVDDTNTESSGDTDADSDTDVDTDVDSDADSDTDVDSDVDSDADSDTDLNSDTDADSDLDTDADIDTNSDIRDGDSDVEMGTEIDSNMILDSESVPTDSVSLEVESLLSECAGLTDEERAPAIHDDINIQPADYCDAEVLYWTYNAITETLNLLDSRIILNCCGEHDITVTREMDGSMLVTEVDSGDAGRCWCECAFDYQTSVRRLWNEPLFVRIVRDISDEDSLIEVWQGTLALDAGGGSVTIDGTPVEGCQTADTDV